ncbi:hypothetical protein Bca52824_017718 [Brassica carinata]|uniref:Uncharacterized protein n=1 Tax=Brassica carinata TaxID=52824 RepID=A0A8X7VNF1_BRACI|nr:hypothetical protein Bca52824_017718 [Brassica carinata]
MYISGVASFLVGSCSNRVSWHGSSSERGQRDVVETTCYERFSRENMRNTGTERGGVISCRAYAVLCGGYGAL